MQQRNKRSNIGCVPSTARFEENVPNERIEEPMRLLRPSVRSARERSRSFYQRRLYSQKIMAQIAERRCSTFMLSAKQEAISEDSRNHASENNNRAKTFAKSFLTVLHRLHSVKESRNKAYEWKEHRFQLEPISYEVNN